MKPTFSASVVPGHESCVFAQHVSGHVNVLNSATWNVTQSTNIAWEQRLTHEDV